MEPFELDDGRSYFLLLMSLFEGTIMFFLLVMSLFEGNHVVTIAILRLG